MTEFNFQCFRSQTTDLSDSASISYMAQLLRKTCAATTITVDEDIVIWEDWFLPKNGFS